MGIPVLYPYLKITISSLIGITFSIFSLNLVQIFLKLKLTFTSKLGLI